MYILAVLPRGSEERSRISRRGIIGAIGVSEYMTVGIANIQGGARMSYIENDQ